MPDQEFPEYDFRTSGINIIQDLVKNANSRSSPRITEAVSPRMGLRSLFN